MLYVVCVRRVAGWAQCLQDAGPGAGAGQRQRGGRPCCVSRLVQHAAAANIRLAVSQPVGIPTCPQGADVAGGLARRSVTAAAAAAAGRRPGAARPEERLPAGRPD